MFQMHGVSWSPTQIFHGLLNFLTCMVETRIANTFERPYIGLTFATAFATACSEIPRTYNEMDSIAEPCSLRHQSVPNIY